LELSSALNDLMARQINDHLTESKHLRAVPTAAPQNRPDAGDDFPRAERLGDVVRRRSRQVCPAIQ
jgi:hypothetical protein